MTTTAQPPLARAGRRAHTAALLRRRAFGASVALAVGAASLVVSASASSAAPAGGINPDGAGVSITTLTVAPGGQVSFTGTGWVTPGTASTANGSKVAVKIDDATTLAVNATAIVAGVDGALSGSVAIPADTPVGQHWLRFLSGTSQAGDPVRSLFAYFTVALPASVTLISSSAAQDGTITASGSNFPANAAVTVTLDAAAGVIASTTSDAAGSFAGLPIPIAAATAPGAHALNFLAPGGIRVDSAITVTAAAPSPGATQVTISVTVPDTGGLAISVVDSSVALSDPVLDAGVTQYTSTGTLPTVTIADLRIANPGWIVNGAITSFTSTAGGTVPGSRLGWAPAILTSSPTQAVTAGPVIAPADSGGLTSGAVLARAAAGAGRGTATVNAGLTLTVPTDTEPGAYTATLTLTVI